MNGQQSPKKTGERIFNAAIELFAEKGFHATSMREIARAVGIKESSLYNHFPGKNAILEAILRYYEEGFLGAIPPFEKISGFLESFSDPVKLWLETALSFAGSLPPRTSVISRMLFNEMFLDERCRRFVLNGMFAAQKKLTQMLLQYLLDRKMIKKIDVEMVSGQYVYMLHGLDIENRLLALEGKSEKEIGKRTEANIAAFIEALKN